MHRRADHMATPYTAPGPAFQAPYAQPMPAGYVPGMPIPAGMPMGMPMAMPMQPVVVIPSVGADLLSTLRNLRGMFISQQVELLEVLTGCETSNRYLAYAWDPVLGAESPKAGKGSEALIRFKESSSCISRQLCGPRRPFKMVAYPYSRSIGSYRDMGEPKTHPDAIMLERPFKCTFLCLARPVIHVRHNTLGYIAQIVNPFTLLHWHFDIRAPVPDPEMVSGPIAPQVKGHPGQPWYKVRASICQWGFWGPPLPCGPCKKVSFQIFGAEDSEYSKPLGEIARVWPGCLKQLATDADNYTISFPDSANEIQKAALMGAVMLIDFMLFESNGDDKNNAGGLLSAVL